jgi:ABC-type polysaccharide/polyol phosphate export permease
MIYSHFKKIKNNLYILEEMVIKELKGKYSGSFLGLWWAVIIPVILAVSIDIIFRGVFGVTINNFTIFALSGIIPWLFFATSVSEAVNSFFSHGNLAKQAIFPREFIPASIVIANFIIFIIGVAILLPLFIIINFKIIASLPWLLLIMIFYLFFTIGVSILLAVLNVFYRDVAHLLSVFLMVWFWVTPIFYPLAKVGFPYRLVSMANPLTYYVVAFQQSLYYGTFVSGVKLLACFLLAVVFFMIGYSYFIKRESNLLKRL